MDNAPKHTPSLEDECLSSIKSLRGLDARHEAHELKLSALCAADNLEKLVKAHAALIEENKRLREALEFYSRRSGSHRNWVDAMYCDGGKVANEALQL